MSRGLVCAYHAATLDGEGCVMLCRHHTSFGVFVPRYTVVQCNRAWLEELQCEAAVGHVRAKCRQKGNWAAASEWQISRAAELHAYLCAIRRYVRQKSDQISLMIGFLEGRISGAEAREQFDAIRRKHHHKPS